MIRTMVIIVCAMLLSGCMVPGGRFALESSGCQAVAVPSEWAEIKTEGTYLGYPTPTVIRSLGGDFATSAAELTVDGHPAVTPSHLPAGLAMQLAVQLEDPAVGRRWVQQFFSKDPIGPKTTDLDLLRDGGIRFVQGTSTGRDADSVVASVGVRALPVPIGPFPGALVHGDPTDEIGTRSYLLVWSDGALDYSLEGSVSPDAIIEMAQSLYCS